jgi:peptidoglycan/xylan/chitin deacetylase (PgdA/CDA1 family)
MPAYFMVSIDTELKWGYRFYQDTKMARILQDNEDTVIRVIDDLLHLFEVHVIPVTWAIVGKLFFEHPEILMKIRESEIEHEIGYHSFSHIRFSEVSCAAAKTELDQGLKIEEEFGIDLRSFVFPENQIGHVDLLQQYGYSIYRGPNNAGKSLNKRLSVRAKNLAVRKIVAPPVEPSWRGTIWEIPSSMMFYDAPYFQTLAFRAKQGIRKAIKASNTFHLFLHPEDALHDKKLLNRLETVLRFVKMETEKRELCSITMGDFADAMTRKSTLAENKSRKWN